MEAVQQALHIDYSVFIPMIIISGLTILLATKFISQLLEWLLIDKLGLQTKWGRKKREEHELILSNARSIDKLSELITELTEQHKQDMKRSDAADDKIKKCLDDFIEESSAKNEKIRKDLTDSVSKIEKSVEKMYEDNLSYRDKSRDIRNNYDDRIQEVVESNKERDELILAIANGNKELLGDKIDQKFDKYVNLDGIPENEVGEFESMCQAYFRLKGNHNRKRKYDHVKNRMKIIPVKTNLVLDE